MLSVVIEVIMYAEVEEVCNNSYPYECMLPTTSISPLNYTKEVSFLRNHVSK